jgi:hypothetical protein
MPAFVPVHPPRNPDECSPWLYEALTRLNRAATGAGQAAAAVVRGEVPDSSGNALPAPDLSGYFLLAGRSGGQIARGGTAASDDLTLVSTAHATKGTIFFGSAQTQAAFDEAQGFFGFGTVAPTALVHIKGSASLLQMEATGVTHTCNGTSGDMSLTATDTGFDPSGSTAAVTAGMLVTGTNVAANTFVKHVHSNTVVSLTVALTGTITGGTITFTNSGLFRRTNDETATDIDFYTQGGLRLTAGSAAPMRILSDQLDDSNIGIVTGGVCSAVNGTRTLTGTGNPFTNVLDDAGAASNGYAGGDLITGSGIPAGTYVVTKVTNGQLTLSNTLPTITTQAMTFKRQIDYSVIEVGTIVSAAAIGANLQLGGPNRGELALFTLATNRGWIRRQSSAGATMIGLGYTANPHDFTTAWTGLMSVEPITVQNADFTIGGAVGGTAPNKTLSASVYLYVQSSTGRVYIGGTATGAYFTPGTNDQIACFQTTSDLNLFTVSHVQAWSDNLAAASSFRVMLGDLNSTHRAAFISSNGNGVMTRLGLSSKYTLITNGQAGGGADFPAPEATPTTLVVSNGTGAGGANASIVQKIQTLRSGQTADMLQILDSTPKVTASISASGVITGTSADVLWEDDRISWEDENVYYSALNP